MKIYKYVTILLILTLGVYCGRDIFDSLAPDTFLYPLICLGLAMVGWGSDYDEKKAKKKGKKHNA